MAIDKNTIDELVETIKNNTPLVYEKGKTEGTKEGREIGLEEGYDQGLTDVIEKQEAFLNGEPKTYYDIFWDAFQQNGNRGNYQYSFYGKGWNKDTLKPKYMMVTSSGESMFRRCNDTNETRLDMTEVCKKLDTSQATSAAYMFMDAFLDNVTVDLGNATTLNSCFTSGNIGGNKSIKNVTLKVTEKCTTFSNAFDYCGATEEIIFTEDSVIASNGLSLQWSKKLNKASIESVINALSTTTTGLTVTLSATAVSNAFTDAEWEALEATKPNWTISLV